MLYLALGAIALWALLRLGRQSERRNRGQWRVAATVFAACGFGAAAVALMRGAYVQAAALAAAALWVVVSSRQRTTPQKPGPEMEEAEARSILGVRADASREEIKAAYLRLIRTVHPDKGGTEGLAARLNAARDRLLK